MSTAGHTPNFIAQENLYPFRVVQFGSNPFSLLHATMSDEVLAGVTDGSVSQFNRTVHAQTGEVVSLQNGEFVQVTAGGTIVTGDLLIATTDGKVVPAALGSSESILQAAEAAEDGEILWCKKIGAWTLGGGVSPITGGAWPDPSAKALWSSEFTGAVPQFLSPPATTGTNYAAGPDYYWWNDNVSAAGGVLEQITGTVSSHFGVHSATALSLDSAAHWVRFGNQPLRAWITTSAAGLPGASLMYDTHEFVSIVKVDAGVGSNTVIVGAVSNEIGSSIPSGEYWIEDSTYGCCGFYFRLDTATGVWSCVSRLWNRTSLFAETTTTPSVTPSDWTNFKIVSTPSPTASSGGLPTIEWYIDGTLVRTLDLNTVPTSPNLTAWLTNSSNGMFAQVGIRAAASTFGYSGVLVDYMHSLTTFTNPR